MSGWSIERTKRPKAQPADAGAHPWGSVFSDHMLLMDYADGRGWHDLRIVPYGPISLAPSAKCLHYGQEIFEGLKAYRADDGRVLLFRPERNLERLNRSCARMCMPQVDAPAVLEGIAALVDLDREWIPRGPGTSLYIRPFLVASEARLSVGRAAEYLFVTILSPVGAYYRDGLKPVRIQVEERDVRAVRGGTGTAKCGGNYAAGMRAQAEAERDGYAQVLWLDGVEGRYVEEVGAMNVFFVLDDKVVTPALNGSLLPGITRDSVIEILRGWHMEVEERAVSIEEIARAHGEGRLREAFGTGTAAVVSPIGELKWRDRQMPIGGENGDRVGALTQRIYDELTGIQNGSRPDARKWVREVREKRQ